MTIVSLANPYPFVAIKHNTAPFFFHIKHYLELMKEFAPASEARDAEIISARNAERDRWLGSQDAVAWIKSELTNCQPWQVLADRDIFRMNRSDAGMILILDRMNELVGNADNETEFKHLDRMFDTIQLEICRKASKELSAYETAREGSKGLRPSDIFRRWALPLRWINDHQGPQLAFDILRDIELEATMPIGELECPEWIDGYTGMTDPGYSPVEKKIAAEINDGVEPSPSESFDSEEEMFANELEDSRSDWVAPVWAQAQQDGLPDDELINLQNEFAPLTQCLSNEIDRQIKRVNKMQITWVSQMVADVYPDIENLMCQRISDNVLNYRKPNYPSLIEASEFAWKMFSKEQKDNIRDMRGATYENVHEGILESSAVEEILHFLNEKAQTENTANVAVLFLSVQHGYGLDDDHAEQIELTGQYATLADWFEDYSDNLVEMLSGKSSWERRETTRADIEAFSERTIKMFAAQFGDKSAQQIDHRPEWIKGYLTAFSNGAKSSFEAVASAWESWRTETSLDGNAAYHQALSVGATPKDAMKAFWSIANRKEVRPKEKVVQATQAGLVLSSGRKVDYHIAALKYKANELETTPEFIEKLTASLKKMGWGKELLAVIK
jgi:hypothetical protein